MAVQEQSESTVWPAAYDGVVVQPCAQPWMDIALLLKLYLAPIGCRGHKRKNLISCNLICECRDDCGTAGPLGSESNFLLTSPI